MLLTLDKFFFSLEQTSCEAIYNNIYILDENIWIKVDCNRVCHLAAIAWYLVM